MSPPTKKLGVKTNQGVLSFVYTCIAVRDPIIKRDWDRINLLNPATCLPLFQARTKTHVCACSKAEPRFSTSYVLVIFMFNDLSRVVIVHFVDIDEIIYLSVLNFFS